MRDVRDAMLSAPMQIRIPIARHFYQTCPAVSGGYLAELLGWSTSEARMRLGARPTASTAGRITSKTLH